MKFSLFLCDCMKIFIYSVFLTLTCKEISHTRMNSTSNSNIIKEYGKSVIIFIAVGVSRGDDWDRDKNCEKFIWKL